ncbi:MetQ/NlpA family ABC transporter substrate-binding protein [Lactobacillus sp. PV012]|uniref:MetQ/NlpA family ABC transporter substrate-binding protein n=1 Tax=Lactobacillus sp. PV012 TaxID=2594494 RepID=UPI00223ED47F|nr:MetQ/NlpA family ABC transporter substrate-binding protein [Lactobacillus sp. PV012]QNQ82159.1 MetQ/NlpA family ABC transporter substrate-binding protein [Lactobacillus sp. PV012]
MHKKRVRNRIIWTLVAVLIVVAGWFSFGPTSSAKPDDKQIVVGVVSQTKEDAAIWKSVAEDAKEEYGINIKIKNFTDYNQPNKALANGDIDLNAFQHYAFLKAWNKANKGDLVAVGKTYIAPIRLYSKKYSSIKEIPDGATIAIPNDASNESRALYLLKNAGLIKLKDGNTLATIADITSNPKHLKIKEVSADQTARVLEDVDASVVNNTYARPAKLTDKETIYVEPINKDSEQWINILVAAKANKNKKIYKELVKAYQTEKTKKLIKKYYGSTEVSAWDTK